MIQSKAVSADVLVVGGGTAGCVAALAAADEGASVILVENDTALGGVATRGGIHRYYYGSPGGFRKRLTAGLPKRLPCSEGGPRASIPMRSGWRSPPSAGRRESGSGWIRWSMR